MPVFVIAQPLAEAAARDVVPYDVTLIVQVRGPFCSGFRRAGP